MVFGFKTKTNGYGHIDLGEFQGRAFPQGEYEVRLYTPEEATEVDLALRAFNQAPSPAPDASAAAAQAGDAPKPAGDSDPAASNPSGEGTGQS